MKVLIIYATNSGSTFLMSRIIGSVLDMTHTVTIKKTVEVHPQELSLYNLILLGSPSWDIDGKEGQPHETMTELLDKLKTIDLSHSRFALFGCGDTSYTYFCGAVEVMSDLLKSMHAEQVAEPLRIDGFYFDREENEKKIEVWATNLLKKI